MMKTTYIQNPSLKFVTLKEKVFNEKIGNFNTAWNPQRTHLLRVRPGRNQLGFFHFIIFCINLEHPGNN